MGVLYGITFFSHQLGSFSGVWLGGWLFDTTGSYAAMWWLLIGLGVVASLLHMPINEQPVARLRQA
jgi:cyanate permease